jgi:hypothetical protein
MKRSTFPPPPAQCTALYGVGQRGASSGALKICWIKMVYSYTSIIIKSTLKMAFLLKTSETKKFLNPNPHGLKAVTKLTASGWKQPLLTHPLHSTVGGRGEGDDFSAALKICFIKTHVTLKVSSKAHWNLRFYVKPIKQKSLLRYL